MPIVHSLRPKQWLKNLLVFAAPLAAGTLMDTTVLAGTVVAFVAFCLAASATYLVNDLRDVEVDRLHPHKRFRPIASGALDARFAAAAAVVLLIAALGLSFWQSIGLGWTVLAYVAATLSYSLGFKHEPVLELLLLSLGFMLRAIAGGVATGIPLSQWFLIVAGFGSLFMAAGKRYSEMSRLQDLEPGEQGRARADGSWPGTRPPTCGSSWRWRRGSLSPPTACGPSKWAAARPRPGA